MQNMKLRPEDWKLPVSPLDSCQPLKILKILRLAKKLSGTLTPRKTTNYHCYTLVFIRIIKKKI